MTIPEIKKAVVAGASFVLTVAATALAIGDIIPTAALPYVHLALAVGGTYGVYAARNAPRRAPGKHRKP